MGLMLLTLLFEVYLGNPYARDTRKIVGQSRAHVEKLLHPYRARDPHVEDTFIVEVKDLGMFGQCGTAGDAPGRCETVFVRQFAQTALQGVTQDIAHALHVAPRSESRHERSV
jgi:hypothetical protein